jgi:hypothetical protein
LHDGVGRVDRGRQSVIEDLRPLPSATADSRGRITRAGTRVRGAEGYPGLAVVSSMLDVE